MNLEMQRLSLSVMLATPTLYSKVSKIIEPEYFDPSLQKVVLYINEFWKEHKGLPTVDLVNAVTKAKLEVSEPADNAMIGYTSKAVAEFCRAKAVMNNILTLATKLGESGAMPSPQQIKMLGELTRIGESQDMGIDYFDDPETRLTETDESEEIIPLGIDVVDDIIQGVGRQELVLVVAPSGGGKSVTLANIAINLCERGYCGVYITLEMKDRLIARRLDSMLSGIAGPQITHHKLQVAGAIRKMAESGGKLFVKRMKENITNTNHISAYISEVISKTGRKIDFIVVDYLDIMAPVETSGRESLFIKEKNIAEELRGLGFDFDAMVFTASQLGRASHEAIRKGLEIGQDHIQGGMSKINTSDLVIANILTDQLKSSGEAVWEFLKSRNSGAVGKKVTLKFSPTTLRISSPKLELKLKSTKTTEIKAPISIGQDVKLDSLFKRTSG